MNLNKFKKKIKTAKNIKKITKAMEMVAASKMKKAQNSTINSRFFSREVKNIANDIFSNIEDFSENIDYLKGLGSETLILLVAPEKGLCGNLVINLSKGLSVSIDNLKESKFIVIGRKGEEIVRKMRGEIIASFPIGSTNPNFDLVAPISRIIIDGILDSTFKTIVAVYTNFTSSTNYDLTVENVFPLDMNKIMEKVDNDQNKLYLIEQPDKSFMDVFLKLYVENYVYQAILNSYASEQSARMMAMKNASDNANDLINGLTLDFNKGRQSQITTEIVDIVNSVSVQG